MRRTQVSSRRGHFNFCNISEESISTHIAVINDDKKEIYCNIRTDYEVDDESPENLLQVLDDFISHIWINTDRDNIEAVRKCIADNIEEIERGNALYELEGLKKQKEKIDERISRIERLLTPTDKEVEK